MKTSILTLLTILTATSCDSLDKSLAKVNLTSSDVLTTAQIIENARQKPGGVTVSDTLTAGLVLANARQHNIDTKSGK